MSLLLNIDTALSTASVSLSDNDAVISIYENANQKDHSSWLHSTIKRIFSETNHDIRHLNAVSVNTGPGSYTGLRVGLSAAKGISYALQIPLVTVNSLELAAFAVQKEAEDIICAAIDARRQEIYTALYNKNIDEVNTPAAVTIDNNSFSEVLSKHKILFCGNANSKLKGLINNVNAHFSDTIAGAKQMAEISFRRFLNKNFADLVNTEPLYLKSAYVTGHDN
ncbi:MAG: tRNA (adenosine(37)-N6)-threonylcarbamoyltransferase complex dimerization subunit type 1 TsaB [Chitinophagaceae bacterium]|nr:tRNA (adenosine(37)-N6)-threonylcarbamoyltransferase complex dimerization subunit type 1 TsaB [Chitinophagaceae bacterium]